MLVVLQFPIPDGRRFGPDEGGIATRPNWLSPRVAVSTDFVRGFGPMTPRARPADPAWTDDDNFILARRAVRFPNLIGCGLADSGLPTAWKIKCAFRRLFHDGCSVARVEVGFDIGTTLLPAPPIDAEGLVRALLLMPAVVGPRHAGPSTTKCLVLQGRSLASQFARGSSATQSPASTPLVTDGTPLVIVDATGETAAKLPENATDASAASSQRVGIRFASTATPYGRIPTWYLGPKIDADPQYLRNLRLCLLHLHAQEESLDQILSWAESGAFSFVPETDAGDRLESFINRATRFMSRDNVYGLQTVALRAAWDASAAVERTTIPITRQARLDGMRQQIRAKAERFIAERERQRPILGGLHVGDTVTFSGGVFNGPVAGTVHAKKMEDSFNAFVATKPTPELQDQLEALYKEVGILVDELNKTAPKDAADVTDAVATFTAEAAKKEPNGITLRAIGQGLVSAAKGFASVAVPIATAVAGVLKIFGLAL